MDSGKAGVGGVVAKPNLWWRLTVYLLLSLRNLRLAPTTPIPALSERVDCSFFFFLNSTDTFCRLPWEWFFQLGGIH